MFSKCISFFKCIYLSQMYLPFSNICCHLEFVMVGWGSHSFHQLWFHRSTNDICNTIARCGLHPVFLMAICIYNIMWGPWNQSLWFQDVVRAARQMVTALRPDDALLLKFWPKILRERNLHTSVDPLVVGRPARETFIAGLDASSIVEKQGTRCSNKQWWSFQRCFREWRDNTHERAFLYSGFPCKLHRP